MWAAVQTLSWADFGLLAGATLLNLVTFAPPWMAALPGLRFVQAFVVTQASTASTYVAPGGVAVGMALSFAMLRAWGFAGSAVGLAVAVTSVWNQIAMLVFPTVALVLLTLTGDADAALETIAYLGLGDPRDRGRRLRGRPEHAEARPLDRRPDSPNRVPGSASGPARADELGGESFVRFRDATNRLLKSRWHVLTLTTLAGHLTVFLVLLVSLRALGVSAEDVSLVEAFAAWSLVRLLGSVPITPGGLGVVELGLTTALVGFGGDQADVVAAVLLYRALTVVPTLIIGLVAGATWKRYRPDYLAADGATASPGAPPPPDTSTG